MIFSLRKEYFLLISCLLSVSLSQTHAQTNKFIKPVWAQYFYKKQQDTLLSPKTPETLFLEKVFEATRLPFFLPVQPEKDVRYYWFEPVYKAPNYPAISYQPTNIKENQLRDYKELVSSKAFSRKQAQIFKTEDQVEKAKEQFVYTYMNKVNWIWDSIPDPPRIGENSYLKKRSADEGIKILLTKQEYDTRPNLEKVKHTSGPWQLDGAENVQLSQGFVENWAKGGENSVSVSSDLRLNAKFKSGKHEWESYAIHKFGIMTSENGKGRVNNDLIEINTKYGLKSVSKWYYSLLYNFKTQFFYGYKKSDLEKETPITGFLAPAYMSIAVGMDYKPSAKFTLLLSPLTTRITMVNDSTMFNPEDFGIPKGEKKDIITGLSLVNKLKYELSKEVKLSSSMDAFYQYKNSGRDPKVQIGWEFILDLQINRFLSTRLLVNTRYYTNESDKVQFRENFNIAFGYYF